MKLDAGRELDEGILAAHAQQIVQDQRNDPLNSHFDNGSAPEVPLERSNTPPSPSTPHSEERSISSSLGSIINSFFSKSWSGDTEDRSPLHRVTESMENISFDE